MNEQVIEEKGLIEQKNDDLKVKLNQRQINESDLPPFLESFSVVLKGNLNHSHRNTQEP